MTKEKTRAAFEKWFKLKYMYAPKEKMEINKFVTSAAFYAGHKASAAESDALIAELARFLGKIKDVLQGNAVRGEDFIGNPLTYIEEITEQALQRVEAYQRSNHE